MILAETRKICPSAQMLRSALCSALFLLGAQSVSACDTALILTIDVSNSVDPGEWRLQRDGLANVLRDPEIVATMVESQAAMMMIQWSDEDKQEVSIPWTHVNTELDAVLFAQRALGLERAFVLSDTAPAEAIYFSLEQFADVPDCLRKVIDISGDGTPNAGADTAAARNTAERQGVTINGIAIESMGIAITNFYQRTVITRDGFVLTARRHIDYPRAIRQKILRELSRLLG